MDDLRMEHGDGTALLRVGRVGHYGACLARILSLADACCLYFAAYVAVRLSGAPWSLRYVTLALIGVLAYGALGSARAIYTDIRGMRLGRDALEASAQCVFAIAVVGVAVALGTDWGLDALQREILMLWVPLAVAGIIAARAGLHVLLRVWRFGRRERRRVAFYGGGRAAETLDAAFAAWPWLGFDSIGCFDDAPSGGRSNRPLVGTLDDLVALARDNRIAAVYITLPLDDARAIRPIVDRFADSTVAVHVCPAVPELDPLAGACDEIGGVPVLTVFASPLDDTRRYVKRGLDIVLSGALLVVVAPLLLLIGAAVRLTSPGPALYRQTRYGLDGTPFRILKFRTMYTTDNDAQFRQATRGDSRVTPLGAILRRTSVDELPQLINVLRGEMSLVGPRPAPILYNETQRAQIPRYMLRHTVKPGITGLAQVSGYRGETETLQKIVMRTSYDLDYINSWSFWLDLRILWRTMFQVIREARGA